MYQNISIYLIIYLYISNTWKPKFCSRDKTLVFQYIVNIFFIFSLSLGLKIMLNLCYVIYTWLMEGSFCIDLSSIRNNGRPLGHVPTSYVEFFEEIYFTKFSVPEKNWKILSNYSKNMCNFFDKFLQNLFNVFNDD